MLKGTSDEYQTLYHLCYNCSTFDACIIQHTTSTVRHAGRLFGSSEESPSLPVPGHTDEDPDLSRALRGRGQRGL